MRRASDQLEIKFNGGITDIHAPGEWAHFADAILNRLEADEIARASLSRRRFLGLGAGLVLGSGLLAACGGGDGDEEAAGTGAGTGAASDDAPGEGKTIGLALIGATEYVLCDVTGIIKGLEGTNYEFIARQANFDPAEELANIENLIAQQVDGIIVLPTTVQSSSRGVLKAEAAGIPCVNQLWAEPTAGDRAYIGVLQVDNFEGAQLVVDYLQENYPEGGEILIVQGTPGQGFSEQFNQGFEIATADTPFSVAQIGNGEYLRSPTINATQTMLQAHPDARFLVTYSAGMAAAAASYLSRTNRDDIVHIASDVNHEMVDWMERGWVEAARYYSPSEEGELSLTILRNYLESEEKPEEFVTKQPHQMITRDDFVEHPPPPGVIDPDLSPASGYYCYDEYLDQAEQI
jgi:ribose transport system substrate-binding protein